MSPIDPGAAKYHMENGGRGGTGLGSIIVLGFALYLGVHYAARTDVPTHVPAPPDPSATQVSDLERSNYEEDARSGLVGATCTQLRVLEAESVRLRDTNRGAPPGTAWYYEAYVAGVRRALNSTEFEDGTPCVQG